MASHDKPISKKTKGKNNPKKRKSEPAKAYSSEDERTYSIDRLNLDQSENTWKVNPNDSLPNLGKDRWIVR